MPKAGRTERRFAESPRPVALFFFGLGTLSGCHSNSTESLAATTTKATPNAAVSAGAEVPSLLAGERIDIPGGAFNAGSRPGDPGRKPELEERWQSVELGAFRIDRLPYPNDPASPPHVSLSREDAERLCSERSERLCTELEWERACKGPKSKTFSTGDQWRPECATSPKTCASPFDVLGLGSLREWTASNVVPDGDGPRRAAVRGAEPNAPSEQHRCAARASVDPAETSETLGFRCCKGAKNAALVEEPRAGQTFTQAPITSARLAELFKANPRTESIAKDVKLFREPDGAETVVSRGPGDRKGFFFTVAPLFWNPVAGAEFLVASGRSGKTTSFVVVFRVMGKDEYQLASSFIMKNETGPVALAYNGYIRPRMHFSTCWGCPGETGKILYRDPDNAVILQP